MTLTGRATAALSNIGWGAFAGLPWAIGIVAMAGALTSVSTLAGVGGLLGATGFWLLEGRDLPAVERVAGALLAGTTIPAAGVLVAIGAFGQYFVLWSAAAVLNVFVLVAYSLYTDADRDGEGSIEAGEVSY